MRTSNLPRRTQGTPLTQLRKQLGSEGRLLSVNKLALIADVPSATLRSVETNRRSFNFELRKRLRRRGFDWDSATKQWRFTFDHSEPLTLRLVESFRHLGRGDDFFQGLDREAVKRRVTALLQHVDGAAYLSLLLDLNDALETLRETYAVNEALKEFQETQLRFEFMRTPSGGQTLVKAHATREHVEVKDEVMKTFSPYPRLLKPAN